MENIMLSLIALLALIFLIRKIQGASSGQCGGG